MPRTPDEVRQLAKETGIKIVDLKFVDLPGVWQHFSIPVEDLSDDLFADGIGFDGSSIRGFQLIHESDMLLIPDTETPYVDPICAVPTLSLICNVLDPVTRQPYSRDPRYVAQKAEAYPTNFSCTSTCNSEEDAVITRCGSREADNGSSKSFAPQEV
jgi:glutamine synthetase